MGEGSGYVFFHKGFNHFNPKKNGTIFFLGHQLLSKNSLDRPKAHLSFNFRMTHLTQAQLSQNSLFSYHYVSFDMHFVILDDPYLLILLTILFLSFLVPSLHI